ncbi:MAG TPA: hypothetical protein VHC97_00925 [Thermoanaerobaculia bacterium]|jgi:hypothetical protein|nr:hypothetical protein [Thermoanaerobaculia bacterium]
MARTRQYLNRLNDWEQVGAAQEANAAELPHLEAPRTKLKALLEQARSLSMEQSTLTASKQEISKKLRQVIREGEALAGLLRTGARVHFGTTSEKLVEFGMQPFRGRTAIRKPSETPNPTPNPDVK